MKSLDYSAHSLYLIFNNVNGYIEKVMEIDT